MNQARTHGRRLSLAVKLGIPILLISVTTSVLLGFLAVKQAAQRVDDAYESDADDVAELLSERFPAFPDDASVINEYLAELARARPSIQRIHLVREGTLGNPFVWASSLPSDVPRDFGTEFVPDQGRQIKTEVTLDDSPALLLSEDAGLEKVSALATYFSLEPRNDAITEATRTVLVQSAGVLLLQLAALALTSYLVVLRRLKRMGAAAAAVAEGDFSQRLPEGEEPPGRDELVNVAREFDHMVQAVEERTHDLELAAERERDDAERLRELDRIKNLLLHAVSHDLRSPITSIMGSAKTLERAEALNLSEADEQLMLRGLTSAARKMHRLVEDILDVERLERGIVTPKRRPTDLGALVGLTAREAAQDDTHPVDVRTEEMTLNVDGPKIERIIDNLVRNAFKHTPPGTPVLVRLTREGDAALLAVEDEGPGVPDGLKPTVFEAFRQGDPTGRTPGVGIGLSLVARFAELHGGRAWVEDRPGGGASFRVLIPDGPADPDDDESEEPL